MNIKALFLCTELAGYFVNCIEKVKAKLTGEVRVYHKAGHPDAPYYFESVNIPLYNKSDLSFEQFKQSVIQFNPDIIYVAGWVEKDYLRMARYFVKRKRVVICGLDNPWSGSASQWLLSILSPFVLKPCFTHIWVAGRTQFQYARHLQFPTRRILYGLYCADTNTFKNTYREKYEKELLFVGRFEKSKGIEELYEAFHSLTREEKNGWKLHLIGNGNLKDVIKPSPDIIVESFMQPDALAGKTRNVGAFILPSRHEHWGVVVQEFAAAGLPLVLSDNVNAGEEYLIPNYNGFIFRSSDLDSLRAVLVRLFSLDDQSIRKMGERSHQLAIRHTPELWAAVFLSPLKMEVFPGILIDEV